MSRNPLRQKLQNKWTTYGLWITIESASITEVAVTLGFDWVVVDMEHGHLDFREVMEHVRAVRGSETPVLVRVSEVQQSTIKRALDIGAHGVLLPLVRNRADIERGFRFGRYPMRGERGVGGERAVKWGLGFDEYLSYANEETMIIPIIETRDAVENIEEILAVEGLEAILFGPADLSATYGYLGQWEGPGLADKILEIRSKAAAKGIASGVMSRSPEDSLLRRDQGFNMIALGSDLGLMIRAIQENLRKLDKPVTPRLWF
jgi:2-keto-3-deoxy-L-rhamnonate aldolase RhmA